MPPKGSSRQRAFTRKRASSPPRTSPKRRKASSRSSTTSRIRRPSFPAAVGLSAQTGTINLLSEVDTFFNFVVPNAASASDRSSMGTSAKAQETYENLQEEMTEEDLFDLYPIPTPPILFNVHRLMELPLGAFFASGTPAEMLIENRAKATSFLTALFRAPGRDEQKAKAKYMMQHLPRINALIETALNILLQDKDADGILDILDTSIREQFPTVYAAL